MKKSITNSIKNSMIFLDIILFLYILTIFIFKHNINTLINPINVAFFMLITFGSILLLGYQKNKKNKIKTKISNTIILISILYLITIYLIGNATGYYKNDFNLLNSFLLISYMILSEIFRYIFICKCNKTSTQQYIITFLYIIFDVLIMSSLTPINLLNIVDILSLTFISTLKNSLLSYTTYKFGYHPCFIYAFILGLMPILAPIYPDLSNYVNVVFTLTYSAIIFYNISKPTRKEDEETANNYKKSIFFYLERILLVCVILVIFLVSGVFKYSISAIASDSMYPSLKKGDAIILEKADEKNLKTLKKDMIVAFEQDGKIVTHRILAIVEKDGIEYIVTKGDNNSRKDVQNKTKDDIIGIVRFRIPYIGYPSVEISETKNK